MTIVIDTNILVSALMFPSGNEGKVLSLVKQDKIFLAATPQIIAEYERVLRYQRIQKYLKWPEVKMKRFIHNLTLTTNLYSGKLKVKVVEDDADDDKFIACAIEAEAGLIVSGDQHLLKLKSHQGIPIVTAKGFLNSYFRNCNYG